MNRLDKQKAEQADFDLLKAQVKNLTANPGSATEGNTELLDIRVDAHGRTYPTAGEAVRAMSNSFIPKLDVLGHAINNASVTENTGTTKVVNRTGLQWDYYKVRSYAGVGVCSLGKYPTAKDRCFKLYLKNDSDHDMSGIEILLSTYSMAWGSADPDSIRVTSISSISPKKGHESIVTIDLDSTKFDGYFRDTDTIYVLLRDNNDNNNNKDNRILAYIFEDTRNKYAETYAENAENAGVYVTNFRNYLVRENGDGTSGLVKLSQEDYGYVHIVKDSSDLGTAYVGAYIRVPFLELSDLEGKWKLEGSGLNEIHVLSGVHDWGPGQANLANLVFGQEFDLMDLIDKSSFKNVILMNKCIYVCAVNYKPSGNNATVDAKIRLIHEYPYKACVVASELRGFDPADYLTREDYENSNPVDSQEYNKLKSQVAEISDKLDYNTEITCWGDSLTAMGGWTSTLQDLSGLKVNNGGTGGESARTIVARQGADVMMINDITIPATTDPVLIATRAKGIPTQLGHTVTPLLQGGAHVNPCYIGDVKGTLRWTGSSYADTNGTWTFTRAEAGEEVKITRPTAIRTDFDINHNKDIMIIFIGQNGGYDSNEDLVQMHKLMIDHNSSPNKQYLILGLSSGSAAQRADYEKLMKKEFGRRFLSLREYLATPTYDSEGNIKSCYGLEDQNLEPGSKVYNGVTYVALDEIKTGTVPHQILLDSVHFTNETRTVIANLIYKRMKELNILS